MDKLLLYYIWTSAKALWADSAIRGNMTIINPIFISPWKIWVEVTKIAHFSDRLCRILSLNYNYGKYVMVSGPLFAQLTSVRTYK